VGRVRLPAELLRPDTWLPQAFLPSLLSTGLLSTWLFSTGLLSDRAQTGWGGGGPDLTGKRTTFAGGRTEGPDVEIGKHGKTSQVGTTVTTIRKQTVPQVWGDCQPERDWPGPVPVAGS